MPRFLAIDWDGEEVRFVLCAQSQKDVLRILKIGAAGIGERREAGGGRPEELVDDSSESSKSTSSSDSLLANGAAASPSGLRPPASRLVAVSNALEKLLKEHKVGTASKTFFALSGCNTNSMYFSLPPAKADEIPEMLKIQAVRDMPNFQEIHPIDFLRLNENAVGPQKILAVSLSRIDLKAIQNIGKAIHNKPNRIEFRGAATAAFMLKSGQIPEDAPPTLLVNLFADELDLIAIAEQKVVYIRSIRLEAGGWRPEGGTTAPLTDQKSAESTEPVNLDKSETPDDSAKPTIRSFQDLVRGAKPSEAPIPQPQVAARNPPSPIPHPPFPERAFQEILRTCTVALQDISDGTIESVIFLGEEHEQSELIKRLREHSLEVRTFNPLTIASGSRLSPKVVSFGETDLPEQLPHPGRYTALLGMIQEEALGKKPAIDILHPKKKPQPPNYAGLVLLLVLLLGLAMGGIYYWNLNALKAMEKQRDDLKQEYDTLLAQHNQMSRPYRVLAFAKQFDQKDAIWLDVIRDIGPAIPDQQDMIIQQMTFVSGPLPNNRYGAYYSGQINVRALVRDQSVVAQLKNSLEAKKRYNIVNPNFRQNVGGGGFPWVCTFSIACRKVPNPQIYLQK